MDIKKVLLKWSINFLCCCVISAAMLTRSETLATQNKSAAKMKYVKERVSY